MAQRGSGPNIMTLLMLGAAAYVGYRILKEQGIALPSIGPTPGPPFIPDGKNYSQYTTGQACVAAGGEWRPTFQFMSSPTDECVQPGTPYKTGWLQSLPGQAEAACAASGHTWTWLDESKGSGWCR